MKKNIYIIWDDCTRKNIAAVATTRNSLYKIGVFEFHGRYRATWYDYYDKGIDSVYGLSIIDIKEFKKWKRNL